mgnify:CR=1 FL=1|tara:strand:- start:388 stop:1053 length:666 start_codon:yes stop_codon:yes gene_type:complete
MFSNNLFILVRSFLRKTGIIFLIKKTNFFLNASGKYEEKFDKTMQNYILTGMVGFDIGANIGFYTKKFAEKVGNKGHIYAFEPITSSADKIRSLKDDFPWITVNEQAVGDFEGKVFFEVDSQDKTSPTNRVVINDETRTQNCIEKPIDKIDTLVKKYQLPDFIKLDVGGFELNVLHGAKKTLLEKKLKHIFIEIHFSILGQRGQQFAPKEIKKSLKDQVLK